MDNIDQEKRIEIRREIINTLIRTSAYASLKPSAKNQLIDTSEMFVNYIIDGLPKEPAARKSRQKKTDKGKTATTAPTV